MTQLNPPPATEPSKRRTWTLVPVAVTVISAVGFLGGALLYPLDYGEEGIWDDIFFAVLALGWILAFVTGVVAYALGRRSRDASTMRSGLVALGWFGFVFVVESIHQAVG